MYQETPYRQCAISVMDTIADPDITFDEKGISNYYYNYLKASAQLPASAEAGRKKLLLLSNEIKATGRSRPFDCIMGLSGGVDSSYVAWIAKDLGLRPLAVHFDNGWDSDAAEKNIRNVLANTGFELQTIRMDEDEYRDIQLAYLKASVVDIEAPTDHAIFTSLYKLAIKYKINYILSGTNFQTEFTMPKSWNFSKRDHINIKAIHKAYGTLPLKTFPLMTVWMKRFQMNGVKSISVLHYVDYHKEKAKAIIARGLGWTDYGPKHFESIWTRFYQGYILPEKFGIDKRKCHLSDLIFSGQMTKEEALQELTKPVYDAAQFKNDYALVLEKLGLSENEFQDIMKLPLCSHYDFDYEMPVDKRYPVLKPVKKLYRLFFPVK